MCSLPETRRSIRRYTGEPVSEEMLHTLLHAGFCAPSAKNCRPWEFVVVRSRDKLKCFSEHAQYQKMAEHAAFAIVVCGDTRRLDHHDLLLNDCSAAVENILLAAHGLGLGAVWCGIVNELVNFFRQQLSLPEGGASCGAGGSGPSRRRTSRPGTLRSQPCPF